MARAFSSTVFRAPARAFPLVAVRVLATPGPEHGEAADADDQEKDERVQPRRACDEVGAEGDEEDKGAAVEREPRVPRPDGDLLAAVAPQHVHEERDRQEER